jgi:hypothetical protein
VIRLGLFAVVILACCATACALTATMVPVEGPMSLLRPVPVLKVHVDGILRNSGNVSFRMPDGDRCRGRWSSAAGANATFASGSLLSQYGTTYVSGYSISTGSGQNPGQAIAVCDNGRTLQIEFVTGAGTAHGFGIAKDNEANIYKLVF